VESRCFPSKSSVSSFTITIAHLPFELLRATEVQWIRCWRKMAGGVQYNALLAGIHPTPISHVHSIYARLIAERKNPAHRPPGKLYHEIDIAGLSIADGCQAAASSTFQCSDVEVQAQARVYPPLLVVEHELPKTRPLLGQLWLGRGTDHGNSLFSHVKQLKPLYIELETLVGILWRGERGALPDKTHIMASITAARVVIAFLAGDEPEVASLLFLKPEQSSPEEK